MNILVIGSGGREHALANAYTKSKKVKKVFVAPGNDFMPFQNEKIETFLNIKALDFESILNLIKSKKTNLVDVAQDDPLAAGFVDRLEKEGIPAFGPTQKASQIEWSKEWARDFMQKYNLPIPRFKSFNNEEEAITYVKSIPEQILYVKASGLALGKGALRAENKDHAIAAILAMKQFNNAGRVFLIEECLFGEEFSLFALLDGENYQILSTAQDHKTVYEANQGPNTGGMGCVSPTSLIKPKILQTIEEEILMPFIQGMQKEERPYKGILYLGGMVTDQGVKVIEFNARWGDPEAEVILPSIKTDYLDLVEAVRNKKLAKLKLVTDTRTRVSIAGAARGYPENYSLVKGKEIFGLETASKLKAVTIFGAGIKKENQKFFVNGGRVFHVVAKGKNIIEARKRAYEAISLIYIEGNNLHYRTDIGFKEMERFYSK